MDTNVLAQSIPLIPQLVQDAQTRNTIILGIIGLFSSAITITGTVLTARIAANTKSAADSAKTTADTVKETDGKTTKVLSQVGEIHTLTNGNLTKMAAALEVMTIKQTESEKMIVSLNQRITEYEKQSVVLSPENIGPVTAGVKSAVKEAVVESVKAPVKEAVLESISKVQLDQLIELLGKLTK